MKWNSVFITLWGQRVTLRVANNAVDRLSEILVKNLKNTF